MKNPANLLLAALLAALLTPSLPALAEKTDRNKPVNIEADRMRLDDVKKMAIYEGHVVLSQGTLMITADRIDIRQDDQGLASGEAEGKPVYFRQKMESREDYAEGWASRIEYDGHTEKLKLIGQARLKRGEDELRGDLITYDGKTELYQAQGGIGAAPGGTPGRVRAVIRPKTPHPRTDQAVSVLTAAHLAKRYKSRQVVADVSIQVESGEVVGLLGPNGAGKTTCFYMLVGLIRADSGNIHLDDADLTRLPVYQRARLGLSYLPQEASIFRRLTVEENIAAMLELKGHDKPELETRLETLLEDLHIGHLRSAPAAGLSGGERRRVEIARALATSPRFMLLDEPFAGIDPISVIDIQKIVRFLTERGIGVLITDHNVRETLGICNRAYILSEGQVLATGTPQEIIYNDRVRQVYLGEHFRL